MATHEAGYGPATGFGVLDDFGFGKSPNRPASLSSGLEIGHIT